MTAPRDSLAAELAGWNAGVRLARASYEAAPTLTHPNAGDRGPGESVPRQQYAEVVRANAALARELRETREALERAERRIVLMKTRGKPQH